MKRTGVTNLPLHGGAAPRWLFNRMVKLSGGICDAILLDFGPDEMLRRLSDPYWFQAFSCVLGFDWHSSGTTTTTCGALKIALDPQEHGIKVCGGKGRTSRKTLDEIEQTAEVFNLSTPDIEQLKYSSRMSAKVDNSLIQDDYSLYHHCLVFDEKGDWTVIQQGMNDSYARRYQWLSEGVKSFVEEPHSGIASDDIKPDVLDMTARESYKTQEVSLDLILDGPEHLRQYFGKKNQTRLDDFTGSRLDDIRGRRVDELSLPPRHHIIDMDITEKGMKVLKEAYELQPSSYEELVSLRGMGPQKIRALALVSDLVYGTRPSWRDPVKYSFAHGGKDGFPFPVDRDTYDKSISTLKDAVESARLGEKDKQNAIRRLSQFISDE
ncbi:MAG: DUF763 domain-containing protein [Methanosarcinales archaeon]|nr:DUF763 domain-containing protein [Methanosarcinales archaeon]